MRCTARVKNNACVARGIHDICFECVEAIPDCAPGQFAHIAVDGYFLRRPFSVSACNENTFNVLVQNVGRGSDALCGLKQGDTADVLIPLGKGFDMNEVTRIARSGGTVWLIGGGIGLAPLLLCAAQLKKNKCAVKTFAGYRAAEYVFGLETFEACGTVTQSVGGFVSDAVRSALARGEKPELALACGPKPFLAALQTLCREYGLRCYASFEERMGCGVGACLVCNTGMQTPDGLAYKRVCKDGPVFDLLQAVFS